MTDTNPFTLDFSSPNPLEEELFYLNLLTENQYNFIKQFQKAFLKHKELSTTVQLKPTVTSGGKSINQMEEIADDSMDYWRYLNLLDNNLGGNKNTKLLEYYFCSNVTMKRLKEMYTKKETKEVTKEYFDETKLYDDILVLFNLLDKIEWSMMYGDERWSMIYGEERMIKRLKQMVKREGICKVSKNIGIHVNTLKKILNGYDKYPYNMYKRIKRYVHID
ncbi:MAG: hypothetical protein LBS34_00250 [Rickettsiales bacterium]|jgi:hypothetical protein|nr:hypothetical protein [Rickettsiales bacterium]